MLIGKVERPKKEKPAAKQSLNEWGIEVVTSGSKDESNPANTVSVK